MKKINIALLGLIILLSSCAWGPDSSAEVTTQAASYSGMIPTFHPNGQLMGMAGNFNPTQHRSTMLNP